MAAELHIGRSTAHRLLAMLVYRDFAVKDEDHTYRPGAALSVSRWHGRPLRQLRTAFQPYLDALCYGVGETVNLMVRVGTQTRFLASAESSRLLHAGDRQGTILPAYRTSGGKALLAELTDDQVMALFRRDGDGQAAHLAAKDLGPLLAELRLVRGRHYAENIDQTEAGVSAVGMCLRNQAGDAIAALSISVPSVRYTRASAKFFIAELGATARRARSDPALAA